ncbi:MAG TPA: phosphate/phosphite/phosphonate ABC transporter substrate-binding protein [Sedimenticola sp.]|nr:phosphate/phosphite/phosphonate ABC transporter substrate-binding protein [Sedimenticola sp.]
MKCLSLFPSAVSARQILRQQWRLVLVLVLLACSLQSLAADPVRQQPGFRIGLTAVFLDNQTSFIKAWERYLEQKLGEPVRFVQRQSYREITQLLLDGQLDAAWICGFPYVRFRERLRLLGVPLYHGKPLYRSYLIVPADDQQTRSYGDLEGAVFAYSDPDSNSGFLVPQAELRRRGIDPARFFSKTFFTWSHRDVVRAVADGLARGGAVDGYVWDTLSQTHPELTRRTRVVWRSGYFGFPPFAVRATLAADDFDRLQQVLMGMAADPQGRKLLRRLNLDGFGRGSDRLYDSIRKELEVAENGAE